MRNRAALLVGGAFLMVTSLAWTTPFGAFPDELDHSRRALSVGHGELLGDRGPEPVAGVTRNTCCEPGNASALRWVQLGVRFVDVDDDQRAELLPCDDVVANARLTCGQSSAALEAGAQPTAMGTIEPVGYVPAGLAMRFFDRPTVYRVARLVTGWVAIALLALGVAVFRKTCKRPLALAGVLLFLTPGTLAVLASGSPNAIEAGAAVGFFAGALALTRAESLGRLQWTCLAVSGFALATSRSLGPIWILLALAVALAAGDWRRARDHATANRAAASATFGGIGLGAVSTVIWEAFVQPHVPFDLGFFFDQVAPTLGDASTVAQQFVVSLGTLPPSIVAFSWLGLTVALLALGARLAAAKDRRAVAVSLLALVATFVLVSAAVVRQNGFGLQARHILPAAALVAMTVGVCLDRWRHVPRVVPPAVAAVVGAVLVLGWGYLQASFAAGPGGLVLQYASVGDAVQGLGTWWSLPFVGGAALACVAIVGGLTEQSCA